MSYLIKLITPTGGHVLDPFAASGSTGIACAEHGFSFTGIEQEQEYVKIAEARINNTESRPCQLSLQEPIQTLSL